MHTILATLLFCIFSANVMAQTSDDDRWSDQFLDRDSVQLDDIVLDVVQFEGDLIACGRFTRAGMTELNGVGRWTGTHWEPLASGLHELTGTTNLQSAIVYQGLLFIDGWFWDGALWSQAILFNHGVEDHAVHNGLLYFGGLFTMANGESMAHLLAWNGESVSSVGGGVDARVRSLQSYAGKLYVGGDFQHADGVPISRLAAWDGVTWSEVGDGISGGLTWCCDDFGSSHLSGTTVSVLTVYRDELYVGGLFSTAGDVESRSIARWNGTNWSGLDLPHLGAVITVDPGMQPGWTPPHVYTFAEYDGELIVGGEFASPVGAGTTGLVRWDGAEWQEAWNGPSGAGSYYTSVTSIAPLGDELIIAGAFYEVDSQPIHHIAAWNGAAWSPLNEEIWLGLDGSALVMEEFQDEIIVGGTFADAGGVSCANIGVYQGDVWASMGEGVGGDFYFYSTQAMVEFEGDLIAGGRFHLGENHDQHVARWDGMTWVPMGQGIAHNVVAAFVVHENELYAGAHNRILFGEASLYRWRGGVWEHVLSTEDMFSHPRIYSLASFAGEMVIGGEFSALGGVAINGLAAWDGTTVKPIPGWPNVGTVNELQVWDDDLLVGGDFTIDTGEVSTDLAVWNGEDWRSFGSGFAHEEVGARVLAITTLGGDHLVVGGIFDSADGVAANNIALWNGHAWHRLGSGVSGAVRAMIPFQGDLLVAGNFQYAGGTISRGIARWSNVAVPLQLTELSARRDGADVVVSWSLSREDGLTGFRLERTSTENGVIPDSVPATGVGEYQAVIQGVGPQAHSFRLWGLRDDGSDVQLGVVEITAMVLPANAGLISIYPNPANPRVLITFELVSRGQTNLGIHDARGRLVRRLFTGSFPIGRRSIIWNGEDDSGNPVPAGVYLIRLETPEMFDTGRVMIVR